MAGEVSLHVTIVKGPKSQGLYLNGTLKVQKPQITHNTLMQYMIGKTLAAYQVVSLVDGDVLPERLEEISPHRTALEYWLHHG